MDLPQDPASGPDGPMAPDPGPHRSRHDARPSRRSLVLGAGALTGAALAAALRTEAAGAAAPPPGPAPIPPADGSAPTTAALTRVEVERVAHSQFAFHPGYDTGRVTSTEGAYPASPAPMLAPLHLPPGSRIREVTFSLHNSGATEAEAQLGYYAIEWGLGGGTVLSMTFPAGSGNTTQSAVTDLHVDEDSVAFLRVPSTGPDIRVFAARIGYQAPLTRGALIELDAPARVYDSRPGQAPLAVQKGKFADGEVRAIDANPTGSGVPPGVSAVLVTAVATDTNPGGFFSLYRYGATWPGTATLNWGQAGTTVSTLALVGVDDLSLLNARCAGVGGAHLVLDAVGYVV